LDLAGGQLKPAVSDATAPEIIQVRLIERQRLQIVKAGRTAELADLQDEGAPFEADDVVEAIDEKTQRDINPDRPGCRDLVSVTGLQRSNRRLAPVNRSEIDSGEPQMTLEKHLRLRRNGVRS
jgi:hypothetical protein